MRAGAGEGGGAVTRGVEAFPRKRAEPEVGVQI